MLIIMKIFYQIPIEDKKLIESYLELANKLKNNFIRDINLYNVKELRTYPTEDQEMINNLQKPSGYAKQIGNKVCSHIKLLLQFLVATNHFYDKNFSACINIMTQKFTTKEKKEKKKKKKRLSSGKYKFYYLNALGCCHFNMEKPALSIQFFSKALQECENVQNSTWSKEKGSVEPQNKNGGKKGEKGGNNNNNSKDVSGDSQKSKYFHEIYRQNAYSKMPLILYNIALAYYKKEEYNEAIKAFLQIGSTLSNNYLYWYRLGICYYKIYIQKIENKYQTSQNDLFTKSQNYPKPLQRSNISQQSNQTPSVKTNPQNQQQNQANKEDPNETTIKKNIQEYDYELAKDIQFWRYHQPTGKEEWSEDERKELQKLLQNSYNAFYNSFLLVEQQIDKNKLKESYDDIGDFLGTNFVKEEDSLPKLSKKDMENFVSNQEKKLSSLSQSVIGFLSFICLELQQPNKVLYFTNLALKNSSNLSFESKFRFDMYKVEALCLLGKCNKAIELLNQTDPKNLPSELTMQTLSGKIREKNYIAKEILAKTIYFQNLANANILDGNMKDVFKHINSSLQSFDGKGGGNLPNNLQQTLIYFHLRNNNLPIAYQYLRYTVDP